MRQIHHILCAVDLSDVSRHATEHAALLARWYNGKITALHVCNPIVVPSTDFIVAGAPRLALLSAGEIDQVRAQIPRRFGSIEPGRSMWSSTTATWRTVFSSALVHCPPISS